MFESNKNVILLRKTIQINSTKHKYQFQTLFQLLFTYKNSMLGIHFTDLFKKTSHGIANNSSHLNK